MKLAVVVLIVACGGNDDGPRPGDRGCAPKARVTPASAGIGAHVELTGERFCGLSGDCQGVAASVDLGLDPPMIRALVLAYSATAATIQIPAVSQPGSTSIVMTVDGRSSNALDFVVLVP